MPDTPSAGEIFRRMNEAKARAADAERRADELKRAGQEEAAKAARQEAWDAHAESIFLNDELGNAPSDEEILDEIGPDGD